MIFKVDGRVLYVNVPTEDTEAVRRWLRGQKPEIFKIGFSVLLLAAAALAAVCMPPLMLTSDLLLLVSETVFVVFAVTMPAACALVCLVGEGLDLCRELRLRRRHEVYDLTHSIGSISEYWEGGCRGNLKIRRRRVESQAPEHTLCALKGVIYESLEILLLLEKDMCSQEHMSAVAKAQLEARLQRRVSSECARQAGIEEEQSRQLQAERQRKLQAASAAAEARTEMAYATLGITSEEAEVLEAFATLEKQQRAPSRRTGLRARLRALSALWRHS